MTKIDWKKWQKPKIKETQEEKGIYSYSLPFEYIPEKTIYGEWVKIPHAVTHKIYKVYSNNKYMKNIAINIDLITKYEERNKLTHHEPSDDDDEYTALFEEIFALIGLNRLDVCGMWISGDSIEITYFT